MSEVSTHRVTGKSCVEALLYPQQPVSAPSVPVFRSAERLAADLFAPIISVSALGPIVATMSAGTFRSQQSPKLSKVLPSSQVVGSVESGWS